MNNNRKIVKICILLYSFILILSCDPYNDNEKINSSLAGEWKATSFTLNGVENIGNTWHKMDMEFTDIVGPYGTYKWEILSISGENGILESDYSIIQDGQILRLSSGHEYYISVENDVLWLSGNFAGTKQEIQAKRK
jgi:hypothetical protein